MQDWNQSEIRFETKRNQYMKQAENARLALQGKPAEKGGTDSRHKMFEALAFATILFLLLAIGAGVYLAAIPTVAIAGH